MSNLYRNKHLLSVLQENEPSPSGRSTPVFSWSPLPQKRKLQFPNKLTEAISSENSKHDLYPNCDVNVWLRSCEKEVIEPITGVIRGKIPTWLRGTLIRNGPGSLKVGDEHFRHLFDASALLHRFAINDGTVTYQCRFLKSNVYNKNQAARRIITTEFGTVAVPDPCHTIFQRICSVFNSKENESDNAMISVYPFGDEIYAFTETTVIHRINRETLGTESRVDVSKHVAVVNHTSHPHVVDDGTVYNLALSINLTGPYHNIVCFPSKPKDGADDEHSMFEKAHVVAGIPARWPFHPSYMHTFGITENYFVIVEQPLSVSVPAMIKSKLSNEVLGSCFRWYHEEKTQINIVSRKTGELQFKFFADAFFYLHIINQYEIDDYVVSDICTYRDPAMLDCMYIETMKNMQHNPDYAKMFRGRPIRFVLPLNYGDGVDSKRNLVKLDGSKAKAYVQLDGSVLVKPEKLCDLGCETPRIYYDKYLGKPYRYFYAISSDVDAENPGTIIKVDTVLKTRLTWCERNCYPSEPIFVANPDPKEEDDGVVLSAMVWGENDTNRVGLIILDARTFTEIGRAEFETPGPVPKCLHGWFLPARKGD